MIRTSVALLALIASVSAAPSTRELLQGRKAVVTTNCSTQLAACELDAACNDCWTQLYAVTAPSGTDCDAYNSWFQGIELPATCPDYMTAGNALSDLAYCYYDDLTKNDNGVDCPIVVDNCADPQAACEADADCAKCLAGQTAVQEPASTWTCEDYQSWFLITIDSYPDGCVRDYNDVTVSYPPGGQALEALYYCRFDTTVLEAGITDCAAVPTGVITPLPEEETLAPTGAPTVAPTVAPSDSEEEAPSRA